MTTDHKTNPEYIKARRRGILFGLLALFSFWIIFAITILLAFVIGKNALSFLILSPLLGIGFAIYWLVKATKYRRAALAIRYPGSYAAKLPKQFSE
jgi:hypothetical protein